MTFWGQFIGNLLAAAGLAVGVVPLALRRTAIGKTVIWWLGTLALLLRCAWGGPASRYALSYGAETTLPIDLWLLLATEFGIFVGVSAAMLMLIDKARSRDRGFEGASGVPMSHAATTAPFVGRVTGARPDCAWRPASRRNEPPPARSVFGG